MEIIRPVKRRATRPESSGEKAYRKQEYVRTVCGHVLVPTTIARIAYSGDSTFCPRCGNWKAIERIATAREITNEILGRDIDYQTPPLPDDPPF